LEEQSKLHKEYESIKDNPQRNKKNNDTKEQANKIKLFDFEGLKSEIQGREKIIKKGLDENNKLIDEISQIFLKTKDTMRVCEKIEEDIDKIKNKVMRMVEVYDDYVCQRLANESNKDAWF